MDPKQVALTANRMTNARAALVRDNPFFGHLALGLQLACAPCGSACTDGERLIFDPEFARQLKTEQEMVFIVLHEVLHCVLEHCTRSGSRDQELYNIACDVVVNSIILEMWGMTTFHVAGQEVMHLAPDGSEGRLYNAEEVYHMLLTQSTKQHGSSGASRDGANSPSLDRHDIWQSIRQKERLRDVWNQRIGVAAAACGDHAQMPQSMRELAQDLQRRSKADWRQLLHDFIQHDTYDYSFLPPDRRFSGGDFHLPAYNRNQDQGSAHDIWVCVDTSGSISDEQLSEAMMEILDAMRQAGLTGSVSFFDTEITEPQPFDTEDALRKITPTGGGGTSFHVIFEYLREHLADDPPKAILVFTDGYVWTWPREEAAMGVPVLWLICKGGNIHAPWGRVSSF